MVKASGTLFILPDVPIIAVVLPQPGELESEGGGRVEMKKKYSPSSVKSRQILCWTLVVFPGGDPFFHPEEFLLLLKRVKEETGMNVWCYTGYSYEEIKAQPRLSAALDYIDVLVDGRLRAGSFSLRIWSSGEAVMNGS